MDAFVETEDGFDDQVTSPQPSYNQPLLLRFGGLIITALVVVYVLLRKYRNSASSNTVEVVVSSEDELRRRAAIEAARSRMQDKFNEAVLRYKSEQAELKKIQAEQKANEWEAMKAGVSRPSRQKPAKSGDEDNVDATVNRPTKPKARLRSDDYNPLTGDTSGSRYRPTCRFGAGGG